MFSVRNSNLVEYHSLNSRLKKKRILRKPNIAEALEQFELLGSRSEATGEFQVSGMCYRSAARCAASLGHFKYEANFLIKATRVFLNAEISLVSGSYITTEQNLQDALKCFNDAFERLRTEDIVLAMAVTFEISNKLANDLKKTDAAIVLLKNALGLSRNFPIDHVKCLRHIMLLYIDNDYFEEALKVCSDAIVAIETLPSTAEKSSLQLDFETQRLLLLLIVEPAASQVTKREANVLEKLTWIDNTDGDDLSDISTTLASAGLSFFTPDLFILLQSLVMACQSCDGDNLILIESCLQPYINKSHKELLRFLVRKHQNKCGVY